MAPLPVGYCLYSVLIQVKQVKLDNITWYLIVDCDYILKIVQYTNS